MNQKIKFNLGFRKSLFKRLGLLVAVFTAVLISVLYYQFQYSFTTQDSILDAHESYYYSEMVSNWGEIPDTNLVLNEIKNLHIWCGIYKRGVTQYGIAYPEVKYWSNLPIDIDVSQLETWTSSDDYIEMYNIKIPLDVFFGVINERPTTVVDNGKYLFYLVIDYIAPSEFNNLLFVIILSLVFMLGLYFFISIYLKPVQLMKDRIKSLEEGDLKSKIDIIGKDELADLSISINKLIKDIDVLLENKHQLLLEVSHELRSPLARMQLLVAMLPEHKNNFKLKEEINFLEGMISNLLLSDRLSLPYSKLDIKNYKTDEVVSKVIEMFPENYKNINVINKIPDFIIDIDETKFTLALRNLIDNAFKYSPKNSLVDFSILKNDNIEFHIQDYGIGINNKIIDKLTEPFFQANQTVSTKGFGLGLTICKKIIESHNGKLEIISTYKKGSCFILHLPININ